MRQNQVGFYVGLSIVLASSAYRIYHAKEWFTEVGKIFEHEYTRKHVISTSKWDRFWFEVKKLRFYAHPIMEMGQAVYTIYGYITSSSNNPLAYALFASSGVAWELGEKYWVNNSVRVANLSLKNSWGLTIMSYAASAFLYYQSKLTNIPFQTKQWITFLSPLITSLAAKADEVSAYNSLASTVLGERTKKLDIQLKGFIERNPLGTCPIAIYHYFKKCNGYSIPKERQKELDEISKLGIANLSQDHLPRWYKIALSDTSAHNNSTKQWLFDEFARA